MASFITGVALDPLAIPSGGTTTATIDYQGSGTIDITSLTGHGVKPPSTAAPAGKTQVGVGLTVTGAPGQCTIQFKLEQSVFKSGLTVLAAQARSFALPKVALPAKKAAKKKAAAKKPAKKKAAAKKPAKKKAVKKGRKE